MARNDGPPRGIRNNNPGNIRWDPKSSPRWQYLDTPPFDTDTVAGKEVPAFCRFVHPPGGIRNLARTLLTYQDKRLGRRRERDRYGAGDHRALGAAERE